MFSGNNFVACKKNLSAGFTRLLSGVLTTAIVFPIGIPYLATQNYAKAAEPEIIATEILEPDTLAPVLLEVAPIRSFTSEKTPTYVFSSTEAGSIVYGGVCKSSTNQALAGENAIVLLPLEDGVYSNCTITVKDTAGNTSEKLTIPSFTIDTILPTLTELTFVTDYLYSFESSESGTIAVLSPCSSTTVVATAGSNQILLNTLLDGVYENCSLTVTDSAGNISLPLVMSPFEIDATGPVVTVGSGNGNNNASPAHGQAINGVFDVYASVSDANLESYYFRVVRDGGSLIPSCVDQFAPENQGYGMCGFVFNQAVTTDISIANLAIASLNTAMFGADGVYWLILGANDSLGNASIADSKIMIVVDTQAPLAPNPVLPLDGVLVGAKPQTFVWNGIVDAVEYELQICATDPLLRDNLCPVVSRVQNVVTPWFVLNNPMDGTFWWRVRARDAAGNWSNYGLRSSIIIDAIAPIADDMPEVSVFEGSTTPEIIIKATDIRKTFLTLEIQYKSPEGDVELSWTPFLSGFPGVVSSDGSILFEPIMLNTQFYGEGIYEYRYYVTDIAGNNSDSGYNNYTFNGVNAYYGNFSFLNAVPVIQANIRTPLQVFPFVDVEFTGSFSDPSFIPGTHTEADDELSFPADDAPWTISVDYGDGTQVTLEEVWQPGEFQIPPHSFGSTGEFLVTVSVVESSYLNGQGNGEGQLGKKEITVVVQDFPVVTVNRDSLQRYTAGSTKYMCSSKFSATGKIVLEIENWNALDSVQGRYTAGSSVGQWVTLSGTLKFSGTTALYTISDLGQPQPGQGKLEVRVVDEHGVVISNRDTTEFYVTSDSTNPACGGTIQPVLVSSICSDYRTNTRKWELVNNNTFPIDYTLFINNNLQGTTAMIDSSGKTFFATPMATESDRITIRSYAQSETAVQNGFSCAARNVSVTGPILIPTVLGETTQAQVPSILEDGISTYRNPELVQTYDPLPVTTAVELGASVKIERVGNDFIIEASPEGVVLLESGEGMCEQFHSLSFVAKNKISGKIIIQNLGKTNPSNLPHPDPDITFGVCQIILEGISKDSIKNVTLFTKYSESWLHKSKLQKTDLRLFTALEKNVALTTRNALSTVETVQANGTRFIVTSSSYDTLPEVFAISPLEQKNQIFGLTTFWMTTMAILVIALTGLVYLNKKKIIL